MATVTSTRVVPRLGFAPEAARGEADRAEERGLLRSGDTGWNVKVRTGARNLDLVSHQVIYGFTSLDDAMGVIVWG